MDAALIDVIKKVATLRFEFRAHKNNKNKITNTINMSAVLEPDLEIATTKGRNATKRKRYLPRPILSLIKNEIIINKEAVSLMASYLNLN